MSQLIDDIVFSESECETKVGKIWYIGRPVGIRTWKYRIIEAWKVLCGKVETVHYKEDEIKDNE